MLCLELTFIGNYRLMFIIIDDDVVASWYITTLCAKAFFLSVYLRLLTQSQSKLCHGEEFVELSIPPAPLCLGFSFIHLARYAVT